jgi:hypothetical protein
MPLGNMGRSLARHRQGDGPAIDVDGADPLIGSDAVNRPDTEPLNRGSQMRPNRHPRCRPKTGPPQAVARGVDGEWRACVTSGWGRAHSTLDGACWRPSRPQNGKRRSTGQAPRHQTRGMTSASRLRSPRQDDGLSATGAGPAAGTRHLVVQVSPDCLHEGASVMALVEGRGLERGGKGEAATVLWR